MLPERIYSKIGVTGFCWLWEGSVGPNGYGQAHYQKRPWKAHRLVYTLLVGPIPAGLEIDHLCRITQCVNPDHLEPVTRRENLRRIARAKGWNFREDGVERPKSAHRIQEESGICKRGHVLADVGVRTLEGQQLNSCLACYNRSRCNWYHREVGCPPKCKLQSYPRQC